MEKSIFKYVLKHTRRDQIYLLVLTLLNLPFIYISLEIPKIIVNQAIGGANIPDDILGIPINQISFLMFLCVSFLVIIAINGGMKYFISVYRGVLGERMLRRFRFELYSRILRFPLPHFKRTSQGEIIPMITAETEPLGGFIGDAFALPAFQGGLLLTYLFFIFQQDLYLGLAAIALYPPQMWLIPKLQRKVNALAKRRVKEVRGLADRVGESISGINEIHAHDTSRLERAEVSHRLGTIYHIRLELFKRKFFIKFLNNFLAQLTPFFFFSIGGYFVIQGELSLGALVAVLAAYKDISPPWKELLKYYQTKEDIRVKYEQIIEQFQPENMLPPELQISPDSIKKLGGDLQVSNVVYTEDGTIKPVDGVNFVIGINDHVSMVGTTGSGKDELSKLVARLVSPTSGRLSLDGSSMAELPEGLLGHRQAYVGPGAHIFSGSVMDNMIYGLKHRPMNDPQYESTEASQREVDIELAKATANSHDDLNADWIDYASSGAENEEQLFDKVLEVLDVTDMEGDVYQFGLNARFDPVEHPKLAEAILQTRGRIGLGLESAGYIGLVERFDTAKFNRSLSVAENMVFGAPLIPEFEADNLYRNPVILELLQKLGLYSDFCSMGRRVAEIMVELFADVPGDSELFEQFSFLSSDALLEFKGLLAKTSDADPMTWNESDREQFLAVPFKLTPARHRLGMIDDKWEKALVDFRHALHDRLGEDNDSIRFLEEDGINPAITVQDNILFGTLVYGQANAKEKLATVLSDVVHEEGLYDTIVRIGLQHHTGSSGARLSVVQKQKLALSRCLLKQPDLLIVNEAISAIDPNAQEKLVEKVLKYQGDRGVVWVLERPELSALFRETLVMHSGSLVGKGKFEDLKTQSDRFKQLLPQ